MSGHIWQYASQFPPTYDAAPVLDQIFSDFKYAGIEGVELMDINLKMPNAVKNLRSLIKKYKLPVTGTSFEAAMWDRGQHAQIVLDAELVIRGLKEIGGRNFGISVGYKPGIKTESELDAQAEVLIKILKMCRKNGILPNLHNHTYEVANGMHDLKGTLERVPELKLGPDVAHLYRAGVDPVEFIKIYGDRMVYLHLRDHYRDGLWTEAIGDGDMDFQEISNTLEEVGFKGDVAIELSFEGIPERALRENWKRSRKKVGEVFGW